LKTEEENIGKISEVDKYNAFDKDNPEDRRVNSQIMLKKWLESCLIGYFLLN